MFHFICGYFNPLRAFLIKVQGYKNEQLAFRLKFTCWYVDICPFILLYNIYSILCQAS